MDLEMMLQIITTLGFPMAVALILGYFMYKLVHINGVRSEAVISALQASSNQREERLLKELKECREINQTAIATIAKYAERLDLIQRDVGEIKTSILHISAQVNHIDSK